MRALVPPLSPRRRRAMSQKRWCTVVKAPDARAATKAVAFMRAPGLRTSTSR